jgi:hypothetical protein
MLSKEQQAELGEAMNLLAFFKAVEEHAQYPLYKSKIDEIEESLKDNCIRGKPDKQQSYQGGYVILNRLKTMKQYYEKAAERLHKENNEDG